MKKENIIDIITDEDGRKIVVITDIRFKGKRNIDWEDVENYLKEYVGKCYEVVETADQVFIGNDFPAELKGSEDTKDCVVLMQKPKQMRHRKFLRY